MSTRLLHVLPSPTGGGPIQAAALIRHAIDQGAAVTIALPESDAGTELELPAEARIEPLKRRPLSRRRQLMRLVLTNDLVHVHGTRAAFWTLECLALRPSVVTFHGLHALWRPASRTYHFAGSWLIRSICALADAVICVSAVEAEKLVRIGVKPAKLHVVRNGVPAGRAVTEQERSAARMSLGLNKPELFVLWLGRLHEQKDPFQALDIAAKVERHGVVLLMAGDGELMPEVRRRAGPNVHVLGHRSDVRALLAATDVVLSTSLWEGLPLTLLEAMTAGRSVVASKVPGNIEVLEGVGILIPVDQPYQYREAILRLRDTTLRDRLAKLSRQRVLTEFTQRLMFEGTELAYAAALGRTAW